MLLQIHLLSNRYLKYLEKYINTKITTDICIVLYSFIVQVDRTQLILHKSSFAYMVYL